MQNNFAAKMMLLLSGSLTIAAAAVASTALVELAPSGCLPAAAAEQMPADTESRPHPQPPCSVCDQAIDQLVADAQKSARAGDQERALKILQHAADKAPKDPRPHLGIGRIKLLGGNGEDSLLELKKACELGPNYAPAVYQLGVAYLALNRLSEARFQLEKAVGLDPNEFRYHFKLAQVRAKTGGDDDSITEFARAAKLAPGNAKAREELSQRLSRIGLMEKAIEECRAAIKASPDDPRLRFQLGTLYEREGDAIQAISAFREALRLNPKDRNSWQHLATIYSARKDWANAKECANSWLQLSPSNPQAHFMKGWCAFAGGDLREAKEDFETALKIEPLDPELNNAYGLLLTELGRYKSAAEAFQNALAVQPNHLPAELNLATLYLQTGKVTEARELTEKTKLESPDSTAVLALSALINAISGDLKQAESQARAALTKKDAPLIARVALARVLKAHAEQADCVSQLREALSEEPNNVFIMNELAQAQLDFGEPKESAQTAQQALQLAPTNPNSKRILASSLSKLDNYDGAILLLKEVLARSQSDPDIRCQLAYAQEMKGDLDSASTNYQAALKIDAHHPLAAAGLTRIALAHNDAKAMTLAEAAVAAAPTSPTAHLLLAEALFKRAKFDASMDECQQVLTMDKSNTRALCLIGKLLFRDRQWKESLNYLQQCLSAKDGSADDWLMLASAQERTKDLTSATSSLQIASERFPKDARISAALARLNKKTNQSKRLSEIQSTR